jgi:hypothetical protein
VSPETVYRVLYVQGRGHLRADLHQHFRTGRAIRRLRPSRYAYAGLHQQPVISTTD